MKKGIWYLLLFGIFTVLIQTVDVQLAGETGREVGLATINACVHRLTGVHLQLYTVTDWLGLVPVGVCLLFGVLGLAQLLQRKNILKVDFDLILLGVYYMLVILAYLIFEQIPVNYRPVFIEGRLEASYPSSTTLLVLSVMPTLVFQTERRMKNADIKKGIRFLAGAFSSFMVMGRLISGVHWVTDIIGAVIFSRGLFCLYKAAVLRYCKKK
mgnify:CR=1 FL=1